MVIEPFFDNVLLEIEKPKEKTDSGVALPDNITPEKTNVGVVLDLGPEVNNKDLMNCKVFFETGREIEDDYRILVLVKEKDILGRVL